jgi:hypothetical protein
MSAEMNTPVMNTPVSKVIHGQTHWRCLLCETTADARFIQGETRLRTHLMASRRYGGHELTSQEAESCLTALPRIANISRHAVVGATRRGRWYRPERRQLDDRAAQSPRREAGAL